IAVAEVKAELDVVRHRRANAREARHDLAERGADRGKPLILAVEDQHLVADVPLDAEVMMRDRPADRRDLLEHRLLVDRLDGAQILARTIGVDHRHRGRQADLEPHVRGQLAALARGQEIEIGGARLAGIAELAEAEIGGGDTVGEAEQRKSRRRPAADVGINLEERIGAQQRDLPADPQAAAARLAIGHAPEPPAEQLARGAKDLLDAVEADAADQVDLVRDHGDLPGNPIARPTSSSPRSAGCPTGWRRTGPWPTPSASAAGRDARAAARNSRAPRSCGRARRTAR